MQELDRLTALEYRMSELERRQGSEILPAKVSYVYRKNSDPGIMADRDDGTWLGRVDVEVEDIEVERVPFLSLRQGADKTFWLPTEGESGVLFSPSGDFANGIFIPGIVYSEFPSLVPDGNSLEKNLTVYRDDMMEQVDVGAHSKIFKTGDSERFINREKIEDKHDTSVNKIDGSVTEIKRVAGTVIVIVGTTRLEVSAASIKGYIAGVGIISVTAGRVNCNGAVFLGNTTNLRAVIVSGSSAAVWPITYLPVPIT